MCSPANASPSTKSRAPNARKAIFHIEVIYRDFTGQTGEKHFFALDDCTGGNTSGNADGEIVPWLNYQWVTDYGQWLSPARLGQEANPRPARSDIAPRRSLPKSAPYGVGISPPRRSIHMTPGGIHMASPWSTTIQPKLGKLPGKRLFNAVAPTPASIPRGVVHDHASASPFQDGTGKSAPYGSAVMFSPRKRMSPPPYKTIPRMDEPWRACASMN